MSVANTFVQAVRSFESSILLPFFLVLYFCCLSFQVNHSFQYESTILLIRRILSFPEYAINDLSCAMTKIALQTKIEILFCFSVFLD